MILRNEPGAVLAITQPDHAALAADLIASCQTLVDHPRRDAILFAAREHDNGWLEEDASGHIDPQTGAPLDFIHVPEFVKHRIWPRAVARVGTTRPYEAALIAQHALTVHAHMQNEPGWRSFFELVTALREQMLQRGGGRETLDADYKYVRTADWLSLIFCNAWRDRYDLPMGGGTQLKDDVLEISAPPFAGVRQPFQVRARRLARRTFSSLAAFRAALDAAPRAVISGTAVGG